MELFCNQPPILRTYCPTFLQNADGSVVRPPSRVFDASLQRQSCVLQQEECLLSGCRRSMWVVLKMMMFHSWPTSEENRSGQLGFLLKQEVINQTLPSLANDKKEPRNKIQPTGFTAASGSYLATAAN